MADIASDLMRLQVCRYCASHMRELARTPIFLQVRCLFYYLAPLVPVVPDTSQQTGSMIIRDIP